MYTKSKMRILSRYILKEHVGPFFLGFFVLSFILLMDQIFTLIDMLIGKGLPFLVVLEVFGLSLPFIFAVTIPMAVLVSSLMAFGRMAGDNEVTAMKAGGISFFKMILSPICASFFLFLFMSYFNNAILPEANHRVKNLLIDISIKRPALKIKEGAFITDFEEVGYIFFIKKVDVRASKIYDVTVFNVKKGTRPFQPEIPRIKETVPSVEAPQTIVSKSGDLIFSADGRTLTVELHSGIIHDLDKKNPKLYRTLPFEKMTINLSLPNMTLQRQKREYRSEREMSAEMMWEEVKRLKKEILASDIKNQKSDEIRFKEHQIKTFMVEIHKKFSIAFACIVFVLLGAPLGVMAKKGGVGIGFGISLGFFVLYYIFLLGGEELAQRGFISPFWAMWGANVLLGLLGLFLIYHKAMETKLLPKGKHS